MLASSSRMKWVKTPLQTLARNDPAATNMPHCIISWARPALRRNVDLPPELAPVMITSDLPSASTSLPTTPSIRSARQASRRSAQHSSCVPTADGTGNVTGLLATSWSCRLRQLT